MRCDETLHHLYLYMDGEASLVRRWRIRRHLRHCSPCGEGLVFEERLRVRIREGCRDEVPRDVIERLREFLQGHADDGK